MPDMNIQYFSNYENMSQMAFDSILSDLKFRSRQFMCVATGNSPRGTYNKLADIYNEQPNIFKEVSIVKLDEWGGIRPSDAQSCETFIRHKILEPLKISDDRFVSFKSNPTSPEKECKRVQKEIEEKGPIDICILGLGKNGHIGFNEPEDSLSPNCHVVQLSIDSLQHQMTNAMHEKPSYGLTLGMGDILQSKKIILLITGSNKEKIIDKLFEEKITTHLPASFLWMHPNVECYIDSESLQQIK